MCIRSYFGFIQVKLDKLVNPDKAVADYRTDITGITAEDLEKETCSLLYVQVVTGIWLEMIIMIPIYIAVLNILVYFVEIFEEPIKKWNNISRPQFE